MAFQDFTNNPEFRRTSRNIVDDTIKRVFYVGGMFLKGTIDFIKSMVFMVMGK